MKDVQLNISDAPGHGHAEAQLRLAVEIYANCASRLADWMEGNIRGGLAEFTFLIDRRRKIRIANCLKQSS